MNKFLHPNSNNNAHSYNMDSRETVKKILFIFFIAFFIRVAYLFFFVDVVSLTYEDQGFYIQLGQIMAKTGDFTQLVDGNYNHVTERVPGYPAFLALIYTLIDGSNMSVLSVQIIIDSLTCVLIGLITKSVIPRGFLVAGLISALNLNMIILSGMVLTDTLFLFLFSLFILFSLRFLRQPKNLHIFLAISFLCIATLVRPVSYYLVFLLLPLLMVFFVWIKIPFKQVMYTLLLYVIPIVMVFWSIHHRNYTEYNSLSLVSQGGSHALYWVVPATYQYSGQGSYQDGQAFAKNYLERAMNRDNLESPLDNPFKSSNYLMSLAKDALLELGLLNMLHAWSAGTVINFLTPSAAYAPAVRAMEHPSFYATPGNGAVEKLIHYVINTNGFIYLLIIAIGTIISLIFLTMSMFGIYKMIKFPQSGGWNKGIIVFLLFIIIYFAAITGPIVGVKYRLPIEPVMIIFFSYAWIYFRKKKDKN